MVISFLPPLAFLLCVVLLSWLLKTGRAHTLALDEPNHRSLHTTPTPRTGGLGVMAGVLVATIGVGETVLSLLMFGLALISWLDDRRHIPIPLRFAAQVAAAAVWVGGSTFTPWAIAAILLLVWMANLYNFMDGADGLAGGMAVFGFGAYAAAAWIGGNLPLSVVGAAIAAAALGFLRFNFPPARMFMGDVGSVPLGFAAGALGYQGWQESLWPWWFPLLVFSPFVVDASVTLARRIFRGERVWRPHCEHYYQRLVRMGWGHRKTTWAEYCLMVAVALSSLALMSLPVLFQIGGLLAWVIGYAVLARQVDRAWAASVQR